MPQARDRAATDRPRVLAPAPLIFLPVFALGWILDRALPADLRLQAARWPIGSVLLVLSIVIVVKVLQEFRARETPFDATRPATTLVTTGMFRRSRNPGYVSMVLLALAVGVLADAFWILALLVPAVLVLHYGVVLPEERHLEAVFGDEFRAYRASVRRWL